jgi:hypothetical protein
MCEVIDAEVELQNPPQCQNCTETQWKYLLDHQIIRQVIPFPYLYFILVGNKLLTSLYYYIKFSDHHRHTRGSLTEKIKNSVYQTFAEKKLPIVKSIVGGWAEWKKLPETKWNTLTIQLVL